MERKSRSSESVVTRVNEFPMTGERSPGIESCIARKRKEKLTPT